MRAAELRWCDVGLAVWGGGVHCSWQPAVDWAHTDEASSARHLVEALTSLVEDGPIAPQSVMPLVHLLLGAMNEAAALAGVIVLRPRGSGRLRSRMQATPKLTVESSSTSAATGDE
ncbi:hypothetical protein [Streptomyces sp. NBC_00028]|uniref:hypothetical protein n=1 Tax=Streptomyces sp. NBC_00028 TaxID=2975624 RepID=UPI0038690FF4